MTFPILKHTNMVLTVTVGKRTLREYFYVYVCLMSETTLQGSGLFTTRHKSRLNLPDCKYITYVHSLSAVFCSLEKRKKKKIILFI